MGIHPIKLSVSVAVLFSATLAAQPLPSGDLFEQIRPGPQGAWRTRGCKLQMVVVADGFAIQQGQVMRRFRWASAMGLGTLTPEQQAESHSYLLAAPGVKGRLLPHAAAVRDQGSDANTSVRYYFGSRGLEFDIELQPGAPPSHVVLESLDEDLSLNAAGHVLAGTQSLSIKPVAYTVDSAGRRLTVPAAYKLSDRRHLAFELGSYDRRRRLVLDPVMTYATFFGGSGDESPVAIREMPDGSVLFAGNTKSFDLPQGVALSTLSMEPSAALANQQCFVARIEPAKKQIRFVSYFGGSGFNSCSAMDLDSSGRILLAGVTEGSPTLATPGAQHPSTQFTVDGFLARISPDGRTLDYSTYLDMDLSNSFLFMRAGPGDTAYLAHSNPILLMRYNIASKKIDQQVSFGDRLSEISGISVSLFGAIYIFGQTSSQSIPLKNPIQSTPPLAGQTAGLAAAFSPDFQTLLFSTYLGGQQGSTGIKSLVETNSGALWLVGLGGDGSIPGLHPARPPASFSSPFAVLVTPGAPGFSKAFFAGDGYFSPSPSSAQSILFPDGRLCLASEGNSKKSFPGGAALGPAPAAGGFDTTLLGCLNDAGNDFQLFTTIGATLIAPSQTGGIWTLTATTSGNAVPFDFKSAAIQPFSHLSAASNTDLVLRNIDLSTPKPVLVNPQPVELLALQSNYSGAVNFAGRNFSLGMELTINGQSFPVTVNGPTTASLVYYAAPQSFPFNQVLNIPAGIYTGQFSIPAQPTPVVSDTFPVTVSNLPPAFQPFRPGNDPLTFGVAPPVYDDSKVLWNGKSVALTKSAGAFQVQLTADQAPPGVGEFTLINQRPGGGSRIEDFRIGSASSSPEPFAPPTLTRVPADAFQIDRAKKILYTIGAATPNSWTVSSYSLPQATLLRSASVDKGRATRLVDFKVSPDGAFLYAYDDLLRITRITSVTLTQDLQFNVPVDGAVPVSGMQQTVTPLDGASGAILVSSQGGRLLIYDGDKPRPYSTSDFPSAVIGEFDPVLATSGYVYALSRADVYNAVPCLARYPIDALGFGPAENICNPGANWGKYPEMKVYAGNLVLENSLFSFGIRQQPDSFGSMRIPWFFDATQNLVSRGTLVDFNFNTRLSTSILTFLHKDTGEPIGEFPGGSYCQALSSFNCPPGSILGYPTNVVFLDDMLIYLEGQFVGPANVVVLPQWRAVIHVDR